MLNIIGGTYVENCIEPKYNELYGSGLRAAAALSDKGFPISYHSCIGKDYEELANYKAKAFNFDSTFMNIPSTIEFDYYHPLSRPVSFNVGDNIHQLHDIKADNILYYGMIEAKAKITGEFVVYDPQNHKSFKSTSSFAKHLALILNKKEAFILSQIDSCDLIEIGKDLLKSENAEVIVIKNDSQGALVFEGDSVKAIPVFETEKVWPIGTGDIFSAVFAWKWMIEKKSSFEAAYYASKLVAQYCESQQLPLVLKDKDFKELEKPKAKKLIYLAGPFFSFGERFLIHELRTALLEFGNSVFSPYHDAGILNDDYTISQAKEIAKVDLNKIEECDTVLAVLSGNDSGTLFEVGYAKAIGKKVVLLSENVGKNDLTMMIGTECEITNDFSTAVYKASW